MPGGWLQMCAVIKVGQVAAAQLKQPQLEHYSM
jgi:hypothetical protein